MKRLRTSVPALLMVVAVACSSTSGNRAGDRSTDGATGSGTTSGGGPAGTGSPSGASGPAGVAQGGGRGARGSAPSVLATTRRASGAPITIGIQYNADTAAAYAAFGAGSSDVDELAVAKAMVAYVNANGGMAGRRVVPVYHPTEVLSGTYASQAQAACTAFTEDNKVVAAVSIARLMFDLVSCLSSKKVPLIVEYSYFTDRTYYDEYRGFLYQQSSINASRWGRVVDMLVDGGFLSPGNKIGLIRWDTPIHERVSDGVVKPALARRGYKVTREYLMSFSTSSSAGGSVGSGASQMAQAVLQFRNAKIDRVLFLGTSGVGPFLFMPQAQSQGYHPRYALTSPDLPQFTQANVPAEQLRGAMAVGWWPERDVDFAQDPGRNPKARLCLDIMKKAGITYPDRFSEGNALLICDEILFLKTALDRASAVTPAGLRAAVERLGTSYVSSFAFGTSFAPGRYDGGTAARLVVFDDACKCWEYRGALRRIP